MRVSRSRVRVRVKPCSFVLRPVVVLGLRLGLSHALSCFTLKEAQDDMCSLLKEAQDDMCSLLKEAQDDM